MIEGVLDERVDFGDLVLEALEVAFGEHVLALGEEIGRAHV